MSGVSFEVPFTGQRVNTNRPIRGVAMPIAVGAIAVATLLLIIQLGRTVFNVGDAILPGDLGGEGVGVPTVPASEFTR